MGQENNQKTPLAIEVTTAGVFKRLVISLWLLFLYVLCMALVMSSLSGALFQEKLSKIKKPAEFSEHKGITLKKEGEEVSSEGDDSETRRIAKEVIKLVEVKKISTQANEKDNYYSLNEIIIGYEIWKYSSKSLVLIYSKSNKAEKDKILNELKPNEKEENQSSELVETTKPEAEQEELSSLPKAAEIENGKTGKTLKTNTLSDKISLLQEIKIKSANWIRYKLGIRTYNPTNSDPMLANSNDSRNQATLDFITLFGHDGQIVSYFLEADKFNSFFTPIKNILRVVTFGTLHEQFWTYPRPILKLNLIFSMGILGSLIFVTMEFLKHPSKHSLEMYFFRPFLGMIIALAMYVMVKSGYSALMESNDKDLSPFFISFLGIISGILADQAYSNISFTGSTYFTRKVAETPATSNTSGTPDTDGTVGTIKNNQGINKPEEGIK